MSRPITSHCGSRTDRYIGRRTVAATPVRETVPEYVIVSLRRLLGLAAHIPASEVLQALARSAADGAP
ncbi:MAG: hypothetical protein IPF92_19400 [Myxococcales bacterium]|nr:hypothetical protein [Myxococcales bacterium]